MFIVAENSGSVAALTTANAGKRVFEASSRQLAIDYALRMAKARDRDFIVFDDGTDAVIGLAVSPDWFHDIPAQFIRA